jgi:hypothetical protein
MKHLTKHIQDPQSIICNSVQILYTLLFRSSHMLATYVLHNTDPSSTLAIHSWSSPLTHVLQPANDHHLQHITNTNTLLPTLALLIAHDLLLRSGGLGLYIHTKAALLPAFFIPHHSVNPLCYQRYPICQLHLPPQTNWHPVFMSKLYPLGNQHNTTQPNPSKSSDTLTTPPS